MKSMAFQNSVQGVASAWSAGGLNLMRHAKKSTNRDFKITFKALPEPDEEEEDAQTEDDEVCSLTMTTHISISICRVGLFILC